MGRHLSQSQLPHLIRNQNQIRRFQYFDTFYFHFSFNEITEKELTTFPPIICRKLFFHYLNLSGIHKQYPSLFFPPCFRNILSKITVFHVTFCNFLLIIRHYIFLPLKFPFFTFFCQSCFALRYFTQFYFNFAVLLVFFANIQNSLQMLL